MSLSCALWATSLHQWARRYLRRSQPTRCHPEKRARMRAFYAEGVDSMHIPWAVEGLPTLLHLSLFLFFGGLAIFLFDVDREVFGYVVWWIGLFCSVYGVITVLPLIRQDSPYNSPLSTAAWFLHAAMSLATVFILALVIVCFYFCSCSCFPFSSSRFYISRILERIFDYVSDLGEYYWHRISGGVEMAIEEAVSKRLSKIDVRILDWTITTLGDDDSLKKFFEAIPGFTNSKLMRHLEGNLPKKLLKKYMDVLDGFVDRTRSSNSIEDSEKRRRLDIATNAMSLIQFADWDAIPQGTSTRILFSLRERDDRWITLAARAFGLTEQDLRENFALGDDSVLLDILIHVTRRYLRFGRSTRSFDLEELSKFDIRNTLPGLQHDFCALWNEIVQEARKHEHYSTPHILRIISHHYIVLHEGTDAAPTAFVASNNWPNVIMIEPSSYPLCNLASHHPDSIAQTPVPNSGKVPLPTQPTSTTDGGNTTPQQAEQAKNVVEPPLPPNPTTTSGIAATSHDPDVTLLTNSVHPSSRPTGASLAAVVAPTPHVITSTDTKSHPPEGSEQRDTDIVVVPSAEPGTSQMLSTVTTPASARRLRLIPTPLPNTPSKSYVAGVTTVSNSLQFSPPSISSSIPASGSIGSATVPRLRARGLVNTRNMCFANAVLQLLINLPPSWDLFTELCDLKGRRRAGAFETGGGATPLVDATARFLKEFMVEDSPSTQQQSQPATDRISRAYGEKEDGEVVDSFEPMYMYDAMKEKRQLKSLLVRLRAHVATSRYFWLNPYRTANSRMRKSFFVYTLTRLMKNCPRYLLPLVVACLPVLHLKEMSVRYLSQARVSWKVKAPWCVDYSISLN